MLLLVAAVLGIAPIQNKIGAFLADPLLNRILTSPGKDLHIRRIMDDGGVLSVNLAKGRLGEDSSTLLVTTIGLAAFSRAAMPVHRRRDFFVYVDEFQSFDSCRLYEQDAQIAIALFGYPAKDCAVSSRHLSGYQPEPGAEVASL